jgi:hypothetical protein
MAAYYTNIPPGGQSCRERGTFLASGTMPHTARPDRDVTGRMLITVPRRTLTGYNPQHLAGVETTLRREESNDGQNYFGTCDLTQPTAEPPR